jgi:predicted lipid-binding transport protein (Tim44 family)
MRVTQMHREFAMSRWLAGLAGALSGAAICAAHAAPATAHGGWLPTLGTFALGGLLGSLFGNSGFGAAFILTLVAVISVVALRVFGKPKQETAVAPQFAGLGAETVPAPPPSQAAGFVVPAAQPGAAQAPAGFDVAGFLRAAKINFVKLQVANDLGRLEAVREFTTAEMYDALKANGSARGGARQADVVALNADLLEIGTEGDPHLASVRFSGMAREAPGAAPVGFAEIWSLAKPANGASGWLLAGIQQMH